MTLEPTDDEAPGASITPLPDADLRRHVLVLTEELRLAREATEALARALALQQQQLVDAQLEWRDERDARLADQGTRRRGLWRRRRARSSDDPGDRHGG